jgi:hypothetical protein
MSHFESQATDLRCPRNVRLSPRKRPNCCITARDVDIEQRNLTLEPLRGEEVQKMVGFSRNTEGIGGSGEAIHRSIAWSHCSLAAPFSRSGVRRVHASVEDQHRGRGTRGAHASGVRRVGSEVICSQNGHFSAPQQARFWTNRRHQQPYSRPTN